MSDFIVIAPDGWIQIDFDNVYAANPDFNTINVDNWINTGQFSYIEEILKSVGVIGPSAIVIAARRIDPYFAIQLG